MVTPALTSAATSPLAAACIAAAPAATVCVRIASAPSASACMAAWGLSTAALSTTLERVCSAMRATSAPRRAKTLLAEPIRFCCRRTSEVPNSPPAENSEPVHCCTVPTAPERFSRSVNWSPASSVPIADCSLSTTSRTIAAGASLSACDASIALSSRVDTWVSA